MATPNEDQIAFLREELSSTTPSALADLWSAFLSSKGYMTGSLQDRLNSYYAAEGYSGSFQDKWAKASARRYWLPANIGYYQDFIRGNYYNDAFASSSDVTDTHGQTINVEDASGLWVPKAANVLCLTNNGLQTVPTRQNKCTNFNANPTDLTNVSVIGGDVVVTVVDDAAALAAAGLSSICTSGKVYKLDNTAGATGQGANFSGATANTNAHSFCAYMRSEGGAQASITDSFGSGTVSTTSAAYTRLKRENYTPGGVDRVLGARVAAGGVAYVILNQLEEAAFASPPIVVAGADATVNGNQQVVDLTGRLSDGVAGFIKVDLRGAGAFKPLLQFSDGTGSNRVLLTTSGDGLSVRLDVVFGGVSQAAVVLATTALVEQTIAFACGPDFAIGRIVGQAVATADTALTFPAMSEGAVGGLGYSAANNTYQITKKLALRFGAVDQAVFDEIYAIAEQA